MVWGNTSLTISQLQINFGNGAGLQTLTANSPINVNYADTGAYVWTIRATLSDNSIVQCYSDYFVLAVPSGAQRFLPANITTPSWGNIAPVAGVHSGATINIVYSSKQPTVPATLRKPLIIVENTDAFLIAPSLQTEPYDIRTFLTAIKSSEPNFDFNQQLDDIAGYDLVFIDFTNGTDGIVRNAAVVQEAINRVNANKQFDIRSNRREQNVVMGIGTGGLHARYALASMAKSVPVVNSETRLLVTHDAPHRGANIALGLQHLSRMLGNFSYFGVTSADIFPEYAETVAFLNAPINVETLLYRATSDNTNSPNTFMGTSYRSMVDFAPGAQPYQFVPTSLGNECARPLFTAGRLFMDFGQGIGAGAKVKVSIFGITIVTIPLVDLKYDCAVYAGSIPVPNAPGRKIAEVKTVFKFMLFGFIQVDKSGYDKFAAAPTTYLAVDGVPGSFNTILDLSELRNYASGVGNWYFNYDQFLFELKIPKTPIKLKFYAFAKAYQYNSGVFTTQYTALPVGSALDVDPFNSNTFTEKYVNGVNTNFPSKGNTFIAQETNTALSLFNNASMRFTARNARFLFKEMEQFPNVENCSSECSNPYSISGLGTICNSAVYSIPGLPRGATVQWVISNETSTGLVSFQIPNPNPNQNNSTINRNGLGSGNFTLTANITGGCAGQPASLSKIINVGLAPGDLNVSYMRNNNGFQNINFPNNSTNTVVYTQTGNFTMNAFTSLTGTNVYNWTIYTTGGYGYSNFNPQGPSATFTLNGTNAPTIPLSVTLTNTLNSCTSTITKYIVVVGSIPGGTMGEIVVSPNPAIDNINVTFTAPADSVAARGMYTKPATTLRSLPSKGRTIVSLFDFNSTALVRQWIRNEVTNKQYNFNITGLSKGLYVLQVDRDDETRTFKLMIE